LPAYYPVFIDVRDRRCVVIGGGHEGEGKALKLLECGARVVVISPEVADGVRELAEVGKVDWIQREYRPGDLEGAFIAIAATNNNQVNRQIAQEAEQRNVLLNVVDVTHLCTFIAPAVVKRGEVTVAVSTGGASPALARKFREELSGSSPGSRHGVMEWADLAPLLAEARAELRRMGIKLNTDHWQACLTDELLDLALAGRNEEAKETLMASLMVGASCDCLNGVCKMWEERKAAATSKKVRTT
jgi:precorrin-2 dehydrogenase/sirohydrochlorin ferrochelatase